MRYDGRKNDELRPLTMEPGFQSYAEGSVLVQWGETRVLCSASVEQRVPPFRLDSGGGWVTGEYAMLPRSTGTRKRRRQGGRETEIQRLVGRSLRAALDLDKLAPVTITVDCDVLQADGGTRVASISGGYVALALAVKWLQDKGLQLGDPMGDAVAAVSVCIVDGEALLDLPYPEDSRAEVDMNLVMTSTGNFVEVQGTGEQGVFSRDQLDALLGLGWGGIQEILAVQTDAIERGGAMERGAPE